jgi:hypothetical protein
MKHLRSVEGASARALEFLVLTAARSGMVRNAHWREFDLERLEDEFDGAFRACVAACGNGAVRDKELARAKFLIFDAPIAILRPHLMTGGALPLFAERMITELHAGMPIAVTHDGGRRPSVIA